MVIPRKRNKLSAVLSTLMTREFFGKSKSIGRTNYLLVTSSKKVMF